MDSQTQILIITAILVGAGTVLAALVVARIIARRMVVDRERDALGLRPDEAAEADARLDRLLSPDQHGNKPG